MGEVEEVVEVEPKTSVRQQRHQALELFDEARLTVSGKAHDFVFVAEAGESQILGERGVVLPQRVGEVHAAQHLEPVAPPTAIIVETKSPKPSTVRQAASSNGEQKKAEAMWAR